MATTGVESTNNEGCLSMSYVVKPYRKGDGSRSCSCVEIFLTRTTAAFSTIEKKACLRCTMATDGDVVVVVVVVGGGGLGGFGGGGGGW